MSKFTRKLIRHTLAATASLTLLSSSVAFATDDSAVVGVMNGENITQKDVVTFIRQQGASSGVNPQSPNAQSQFLKLFVEREALYHEAMAQKLAEKPEIEELLEEARRQTLAKFILENYAATHKPSDAEIKAFYDKEVVANAKEFKLRHIQVNSPEEAKSAYDRLNKGEDFASVADAMSADSTKNGGELGWLSPNAMPQSFAMAARGLKPGEYSKQPVKSDRGVHIIKVDETRPVTPPPLEQIKTQITAALTQQAMTAYITEIRAKYPLEAKPQ